MSVGEELQRPDGSAASAEGGGTGGAQNKSALSIAVRERLGSQAVVYLIFLAVVLFFVFAAPAFASLPSLANIGRQAAAITVVSVGMTVVIVCAEIDLSVGSAASLCGMLAGVFLSDGWPWPVAVLAVLGIGAAIGFINGFITAYVGVPSFLVTLGMLSVLAAVALMITNTASVPITNNGFLAVLGPLSFAAIPLPVWWGIAVVLIGIYLLHFSVFGRHVFATGGSRGAALYSGINTRKVVLASFVLCGILAAFAGLLIAGRSEAANPTVGVGMELSAIAAVILGGTDLFGGRGTVLGTVAGAIFIGVVGIGLILMGAGAQMQDLITGVIIIGAVSINKLGKRT
ncbi:MAG: ABC transporter permease [Sciscionella sp.]